jgi:hypothetical protein
MSTREDMLLYLLDASYDIQEYLRIGKLYPIPVHVDIILTADQRRIISTLGRLSESDLQFIRARVGFDDKVDFSCHPLFPETYVLPEEEQVPIILPGGRAALTSYHIFEIHGARPGMTYGKAPCPYVSDALVSYAEDQLFRSFRLLGVSEALEVTMCLITEYVAHLRRTCVSEFFCAFILERIHYMECHYRNSPEEFLSYDSCEFARQIDKCWGVTVSKVSLQRVLSQFDCDPALLSKFVQFNPFFLDNSIRLYVERLVRYAKFATETDLYEQKLVLRSLSSAGDCFLDLVRKPILSRPFVLHDFFSLAGFACPDDLFNSICTVRSVGKVIGYPFDFGNEYLGSLPVVVRSKEELLVVLRNVFFSYLQASGTLVCGIELLCCLSSVTIDDVLSLLLYYYRSLVGCKKLPHLDGSRFPYNPQGGSKVSKNPYFPGAVFGFPGHSQGKPYSERYVPIPSDYYYVLVDVPDNGSMRCRVTFGLPFARWAPYDSSFVADRYSVELIIGSSCRARRGLCSEVDPRFWTVFRFFFQMVETSHKSVWAVVYDDTRVYGVLLLNQGGFFSFGRSDLVTCVSYDSPPVVSFIDPYYWDPWANQHVLLSQAISGLLHVPSTLAAVC